VTRCHILYLMNCNDESYDESSCWLHCCFELQIARDDEKCLHVDLTVEQLRTCERMPKDTQEISSPLHSSAYILASKTIWNLKSCFLAYISWPTWATIRRFIRQLVGGPDLWFSVVSAWLRLLLHALLSIRPIGLEIISPSKLKQPTSDKIARLWSS
jgi:hypothetical protein